MSAVPPDDLPWAKGLLPPEQRAFPDNTDDEEHAKRKFEQDLKAGKLFPAPAPRTEADKLTEASRLALRAEEVKLEAAKLRAGVTETVVRPGTLQMRTADTVKFESVWWLWPGYLACSFLNLVVGETSAGKSTVLADVAARVTTGAPWPGEPAEARRTAGRVLWLGSEDPFEILTGPRLAACGADMRMVTEIQAVQRAGRVDGFSMQDDIGAVKAELLGAKQFGGAYAMLVIDPITSYLQGGKLRKVDMNDSGQLRTILEPWTRLASDTGIAIVGVTHLAKDTTRSMLHRVLGGGAFAQLCRSLVSVVHLPDEGPNEKAVLQVKSNLPGLVRGAWRFRTDVRHVANDQFSRPITASYPEWLRFDHALTPEALAGAARGPVSKQASAFGVWLRAAFVSVAPGQGLPIARVRSMAIEDKVVSASWWEDHSSEYLEKQNVGGMWMCRPKGA